MKTIAILGAGTAGTMMANKLAKTLSMDQWRIVVIDKDDKHVYQPGLLFLPFGDYRADEIVRSRTFFLPDEVDLMLSAVERIEPQDNRIVFEDGAKLDYDLLIVATGSRILPSATPGLTDKGWRDSAFDFYTLDGAKALGKKLADFEGGKMVLNVVEMPIKCPVAPLEFLFLADAFFTKKGIRDKVEITYATPLEGAFTKPVASAMLGDMLRQRNINVEPDFNLAKVDGDATVMESYDGRQVDYDLLVSIPLHNGSAVINKSEMGDELGFLPTDKHTLQSSNFSNIFAIGDATNLPSSKAGAVAHFQSEVLFENVMRWIDEDELLPDFDGHANCFIETGYDKALLIDFNYKTEPLPGRFPLPGIGPFTLLEESHMNHWGKLAFKWVYWNVLLRGDELPLDHRMVMAGKWN